MCFAYRDGERSEALIEHMKETANYCLHRWELDALSAKISKLLGIGQNHVKEAIIVAALTHDIGKAAEIYQIDCIKNTCKLFEGHYMVSAFLLHLAFNAKGIYLNSRDAVKFLLYNPTELASDKVLALLIVLPVITHHYHQVRGYLSYESSKHNAVSKFLDKPTIHRPCLDCFSEMLGYAEINVFKDFMHMLYNVLVSIDRLKGSDKYNTSKIFVENFFKSVIEESLKINSVTLGKVIVESISGLINLCDGFAASRSRKRG
ncbi:CRISPR-associated endonuclease Cas3'' [Ignisphaera sp. 4213-co]|uniref:CRISPR-associated endonuclease Cas3 n=1 Tax=Ignisphaera cupida TaxID=3050454 RepID=A0ABD4Z7S5_9CREN|nr:CRISPR-associated endonuclease Cas3'' [Ignisphaera sp. 4213-co]MDK6029407.1 CRISPR-associated endonuclease Cas3'' [Ignisphaera sp. 4213-co]